MYTSWICAGDTAAAEQHAGGKQRRGSSMMFRYGKRNGGSEGLGQGKLNPADAEISKLKVAEAAVAEQLQQQAKLDEQQHDKNKVAAYDDVMARTRDSESDSDEEEEYDSSSSSQNEDAGDGKFDRSGRAFMRYGRGFMRYGRGFMRYGRGFMRYG